MTTQSGRQRAPKALAKNTDFPCVFEHFLLFGIHLVATPGAPFMFKMRKKALRFKLFRETIGDHLEASGWGDKK